MKIVFFGTPEYVVPILDALHNTFKKLGTKSPIMAVVTQKPKPAGRKKILRYTPVDTWAHRRKIPVYHDSEDLIKGKVNADLGVLAAYGAIIPKRLIDHFPHGILNLHPSLLPKFRGASPVQATIVSGDKETGVSIIKLDEELDHGPIISQFKIEVQTKDTSETLRKRCFQQSAETLVSLLPAYLKGKITPRKQNHTKATYTTLLKKEHGFIPPEYLELTLKGQSFKGEWKIPFIKTKSLQASLIKDYPLDPTPYALERFIRAMQPWPHAWIRVKILRDKDTKILRLKLLKAHLDNDKLVLDEVQLEGKKPVSWKQFRQAYPKATFE